MPQYASTSRAGIARSPRQTRGSSASATTTISMRHHTSGSADRLISLPRMGVKPHSSTHRWICSWAFAVGVIGMRALSPKRPVPDDVRGFPAHRPRGKLPPTPVMPGTTMPSVRLPAPHRVAAAVVGGLALAALVLQYALLL